MGTEAVGLGNAAQSSGTLGHSTTVVHARFAPRRGTQRSPWWGKAWQGAVEECTLGDHELKSGRKHARAGRVGRIHIAPGQFVAPVEIEDEVWTVKGTVALFDEESVATLVEIVSAQAGRIGALLAGDLPRDMVEECEELGVELVPSSGDLDFSCTCEPWTDPCPHAI